jgi:hypothetical protein
LASLHNILLKWLSPGTQQSMVFSSCPVHLIKETINFLHVVVYEKIGTM